MELQADIGALLVGRVPHIPGARCASITAPAAKRGFVTLAASDEVAIRIDAEQYELGDGPCLRAVDGTAVAADISQLWARWPELTQWVVTETSVRSVLSHPLGLGARGSLNIYSDRVEGLAAHAITAAADLAQGCAFAMAAARERARADNLVVALESSRRIGAAVGIVMAASRCTYEQAFETIRRASQHTHRKLRDVADEIILTGTVPDR